MKKQWWSNINNLIKINLNLAELIDSVGNKGDLGNPSEEFKHVMWLCHELGLGYRALTGYIRKGVKEVIDTQGAVHSANESAYLAKVGEEEARDFLEDIFGDRDAYCFNDEIKARIREAVRKIEEDWEKENVKD